ARARKFGQKRVLAVRRSWRGNGVACFGLPPWKNFRRRDRDHLIPPPRMDVAVCRAEVCYPFGSELRETTGSETTRVHIACRRCGGCMATRGSCAAPAKD